MHCGVHIMAGCRVEENVTLFPGVVLYEGTRVGPRCIIHSGTVLGAYGFGYKLADGKHVLSSQLGYVELGADVEIGAGSTIDRGTYGATVIGEGTKIDNLVMIAHNVRLGPDCVVVAQSGISGSTRIGAGSILAAQVGVTGHLILGPAVRLAARSAVIRDLPGGDTYGGAPAVPIRQWRRQLAAMTRLGRTKR